MELLAPERSLLIWSVLTLSVVLLMIVALIHLLLNKSIVGKDALLWAFAIAFIPVIGSILYFKSSRKDKSLQ